MATINIPSLPGPNTKLSPLVVEKIAEAKEAIRQADKDVRTTSNQTRADMPQSIHLD